MCSVQCGIRLAPVRGGGTLEGNVAARAEVITMPKMVIAVSPREYRAWRGRRRRRLFQLVLAVSFLLLVAYASRH